MKAVRFRERIKMKAQIATSSSRIVGPGFYTHVERCVFTALLCRVILRLLTAFDWV